MVLQNTSSHQINIPCPRVQTATTKHPTDIAKGIKSYIPNPMRIVESCCHAWAWQEEPRSCQTQALSSRSPILYSSSCFLVVSNQSLVVLSSTFVKCRWAWVVWSSFWVVYNWPWSWVTNSEERANEVPEVECLELDGLSNTDAPSLPSPSIVSFSLQPQQALKKR